MAQVSNVGLDTIDALILHCNLSEDCPELGKCLIKGVLSQLNVFHIMPQHANVRAHGIENRDGTANDGSDLDQVSEAD